MIDFKIGNKCKYLDLLQYTNKMYKEKDEKSHSRILNGVVIEIEDEFFNELYAYDKNTDSFLNGEGEHLEAFHHGKSLTDLEVKIVSTYIPKDITLYNNGFNYTESLATYKIRKKLEEAYMDLDMALDNCQGCTSDLEVKFAELRLYEKLLDKLNCEVEVERSRLVDEWFNERKQERELVEKQKNDLYEHIRMNMDLLISNEPVKDIIMEIIQKINKICDYIRETDVRDL